MQASLRVLGERVDHLKDYAEDRGDNNKEAVFSITSSELNQIFSGEF